MLETAIATVAFLALVVSWAILPAGKGASKDRENTATEGDLVA